MKLSKICVLCFFQFILFPFVLLIFLKTTELPLRGEIDYLTQMGMIKVNQMSNAPGFVLPNLKGGKISLKDFRGKFVMLNFWATW